jgi:hypothetical protein
VAVPPRRNPLANGIAIGMRIAFFILVPLGIIAAIAIPFLLITLESLKVDSPFMDIFELGHQKYRQKFTFHSAFRE